MNVPEIVSENERLGTLFQTAPLGQRAWIGRPVGAGGRRARRLHCEKEGGGIA